MPPTTQAHMGTVAPEPGAGPNDMFGPMFPPRVFPANDAALLAEYPPPLGADPATAYRPRKSR